MTRPDDVADVLRAVTLGGEVERHARGVGRLKLRELAKLTDDRVLEAVHAGATTHDIARALNVGISRAQERVRRAQKAAGEWAPPRRLEKGPDNREPAADEVVVSLAPPDPQPAPAEAPNVWLQVPRCARPLPPPWPVSTRCARTVGHAGAHEPNRRAARGGTARPQ